MMVDKKILQRDIIVYLDTKIKENKTGKKLTTAEVQKTIDFLSSEKKE